MLSVKFFLQKYLFCCPFQKHADKGDCLTMLQ